MKFKPFQLQDYAAAAMSPGLVLAHDTGLGKSLAAATLPLLWCGFDAEEHVRPDAEPGACATIRVKGSVLIVAPGDLHDQLKSEFKKFYGLMPVSIRDQADLLRLLVHRRVPAGFYLTSYTRLAVNGIKNMGDLLKRGPETAITELNLTPAHLQAFYDQRGLFYKDEYATLGLKPDCSTQQLDGALAAKVRAAQRERAGRGEVCDRIGAELTRCHSILIHFAGPFTPAPFHAASDAVKFVWREFIRHQLQEYSQGISEVRAGIKCLYSPSLADLCSHLFDCVVIDEGVKMKGADTQVGRGLRRMCPKYRLVLTATPVKNRLPDIFWLAWWAAGGHEEPTARWPYAGGSDEQARFAAKFMLEEFNKTRAEVNGGAKSRFKKLRPEICNIHLLWKILAPTVLRRRKSDIGQSIVRKVRHVYRVPMGLHQRAVYRYHLESAYLDCNLRPAPGAKLQALRVAAAAPDSHLLDPQPVGRGAASGEGRECCPKHDFHAVEPAGTPLCRNCGSPPLTHRSQHSFTPKVACALTLIRDILARGEQAAVFSAFNDPSDILSRYLTEAGLDHYLLDGRTNQAKRGRQSAAFNGGECPVTLAGIDSMAEGHNWDRVNNVILTSYTWAADKIVQAINRVHRLTSARDINIYVILCDQSADRVLEDNIAEKTNSSELAIDGRLLGEATEERSASELLREAMRDFKSSQECPNEVTLAQTWPALRAQLQEAGRTKLGRGINRGATNPLKTALPIDLSTFVFPGTPLPTTIVATPVKLPVPIPSACVPSWRRARLAA